MNTLYININGADIKSTENLTVVGKPEDAIVNKFYYELAKGITKGVVVPGIAEVKNKRLVKDFEAYDEQAFAQIMEQWDLVKQVLLGENPVGTYKVMLPQEYVEWLYTHGNGVYNQIAPSLADRGNVVEISIEKIYANAFVQFIRKVDPKEYSLLVVNDEYTDDDSKFSEDIRERVGDSQLPFMGYKEWKAMNELEKVVDDTRELEQNKRWEKMQEQVSGKYDEIQSFPNRDEVKKSRMYNVFELGSMSLDELKQIAIEKGIYNDFFNRAQLIDLILHTNANKCDEGQRSVKDAELIIDWDELFPVYGVTLGETDIYDIAEKKGLSGEINERKIGNNDLADIHFNLSSGSIYFHQYIGGEGVQNIHYYIPYVHDASVLTRRLTKSIRFPEKWNKVFGFQIGVSSDDAERELRKRGARFINKIISEEGWQIWYIRTSDNSYIIEMVFEELESDGEVLCNRLSEIAITKNSCPYCNSNDVEITFGEENMSPMVICNDCGSEWILLG